MTRLGLLLLLAGCCHCPAPSAVPAALLASGCASDAPEPAPLPKLRTTEEIGQWARQAEAAREKTAVALTQCSGRLERLQQWVQHAH